MIAQESGLTISTNHLFNQSGKNWVIAEATSDTDSDRDSILVIVSDGIVTSPKPAEYRKGINYPTNNSAALVLWAPLKDSVYVIGDFNNWTPTREFKMEKDNNYFWLDIPNLEAGKEYAFQYWIDRKIKIADPYTEKILDPWNDQYISASTYPNLKQYPTGKTTGIVSVLQPGQVPFNWEVSNFQTPDKKKLVIYELLVRDFMTEHSFKAVREKLDYLADLRINALELMPVNEFEGNISWGYNPAFYFAPDKYYGPKEELKKLIDECHKRGIAVVLDMVLNHSYGQSPFVQMYMNNWTILPENPWYNVSSPNPVFNWGYDFNHEADVVKELVDSINSFWINKYKVDGFRFDFTKGFTNTPGDGWAYDSSRVQILERMSDQIWARKSDALVIMEHLSDNTEETVLANHGILLWGNMNNNYAETAMGYGEDLSWGIYSNRGWNEPNLVSYMESHDEERLMYKCEQYGNSSGSYDTKLLPTALDRIKLDALFFLPLPGPKMIWQFGELGYDYSINTCENGTINDACRTNPKPVRWDYLDNSDRTSLFQVMAKLNELKQKYDEFSPTAAQYYLKDTTKWYTLTNNNNHVLAVGNFDVQSNNQNVTFPKTGKWYEFFTHDSIEVQLLLFKILRSHPGEYRLYSTRRFNDPKVITDNRADIRQIGEISVYPNPVTSEINILSDKEINDIRLFSSTGILMKEVKKVNTTQVKFNVADMTPGVYLLQIVEGKRVKNQKIVIQ